MPATYPDFGAPRRIASRIYEIRTKRKVGTRGGSKNERQGVKFSSWYYSTSRRNRQSLSNLASEGYS